MNLRLSWLALPVLVLVPGAQEEEPQTGVRGQRAVPNLVPLPEGYIRYAKLPDGGTQPRVVRTGDTVAVLYFRAAAEGAGGDLWLVRTTDFGSTFGPAAMVNSRPGAVAAPEGLHGAAFACDASGRAHVAWIAADPAPTVRYAREKADGGFEEERELGALAGLGQSTSITLDGRGRVCVFFSAQASEGSDARRLYMVRSEDAERFAAPVAIDQAEDGVSEQSSIASHFDSASGSLYVLYRVQRYGAKEEKAPARHVRLLTSEDQGDTFEASFVENWNLRRDPRSHCELVQDEDVTLITWDGLNQVYWTTIRRKLHKIWRPIQPRDDAHAFARSAPTIAANNKDEVLVAWLERPRETPDAEPVLRWQVWMQRSLAPVGDGQSSEASVPPAAFARPDGGFTIVY